MWISLASTVRDILSSVLFDDCFNVAYYWLLSVEDCFLNERPQAESVHNKCHLIAWDRWVVDYDQPGHYLGLSKTLREP